MQVRSLGQEDTPEEEMATHCSILAWNIPWTEEPGGLHSRGSQRVKQDWAQHTYTHSSRSKQSLKESESSLLGFSVCGILQARILEWVAVPFSSGSSQLRDCSSSSELPGKPLLKLQVWRLTWSFHGDDQQHKLEMDQSTWKKAIQTKQFEKKKS